MLCSDANLRFVWYNTDQGTQRTCSFSPSPHGTASASISLLVSCYFPFSAPQPWLSVLLPASQPLGLVNLPANQTHFLFAGTEEFLSALSCTGSCTQPCTAQGFCIPFPRGAAGIRHRGRACTCSLLSTVWAQKALINFIKHSSPKGYKLQRTEQFILSHAMTEQPRSSSQAVKKPRDWKKTTEFTRFIVFSLKKWWAFFLE